MEIKRDVALKEHTTFKIGGNADFFCKVTSKSELLEAYQFAKEGSNPIFILGGGSNVLIPDDGFRGLVIHVAMVGLLFNENEDSSMYLTAGAGENWDSVVLTTVERGFYGIENLSAIPGSVGGAPIQNIGAYGAEVKETIFSIEVFDIQTGTFKMLSNKECSFGYRTSIFKQPKGVNYVVIGVTFKLSQSASLSLQYPDLQKYFAENGIAQPTLIQVRNAILNIRKNKLPNLAVMGTAGSFFKNPTIAEPEYLSLKEMYPELPSFKVEGGAYKIPAGWLIDKVGNFKGFRSGNVGVYEKQALVLVNYANGNQKEIIQLAEMIEHKIKEKTGIMLEREVCIV